MAPEDRYYYIKHVSLSVPQRIYSSLVKMSESFSVEINENVDFSQRIQVEVNRFGGKNDTKMTGSKYEKVTPMVKDVFLGYYNLALKYMHEHIIDDGEFYLLRHSKQFYEAQYFSRNEKDKSNINIKFVDRIQALSVDLDCGPGHKYRTRFRKEASPITEEQFRQFFNLTIRFIYDPDSYTVFTEDYIKNFQMLCEGDNKIPGFIISAEQIFQHIQSKLQARKEFIEKHLIENDTDSAAERVRLRGELDGILYAISVIISNK